MTDTAIITVAVNSGLGNHMSLLHDSQIVNSQMWSWIAQSILIQTVGFGKYAVIAFLLRIQGRAQGKKMIFLTYLLYFIGISNFAINVITMAMIFTSCSPTAKFWNQSLPGTCNNVARLLDTGYLAGSTRDNVSPLRTFVELTILHRFGSTQRSTIGWLPDACFLET